MAEAEPQRWMSNVLGWRDAWWRHPIRAPNRLGRGHRHMGKGRNDSDLDGTLERGTVAARAWHRTAPYGGTSSRSSLPVRPVDPRRHLTGCPQRATCLREYRIRPPQCFERTGRQCEPPWVGQNQNETDRHDVVWARAENGLEEGREIRTELARMMGASDTTIEVPDAKHTPHAAGLRRAFGRVARMAPSASPGASARCGGTGR